MKYTLLDLQPHLEKCRAELRQTKAGKSGDAASENLSISLNKEGAIRRRWFKLSAKDVHIYRAFLDHYTDTSNTEPRHYVDNPIIADANGKPMVAPGRYRNAFTIVRAVGDDEYELIQELRLGWIETLVEGTAVDYSEARVETVDWYVGDNGNNPTNDYMILVWKGVSPEKVEAITQSLIELPSTGWTPVVNGNTMTAHHRLLARSQEEADGSASVRVLLANSRLQFEAYDNWGTERGSGVVYHFGVPSDVVKAVVQLERTLGATARITPPDNRGLHDITIFNANPEKYEKTNVKIATSCSEDVFAEWRLGLTEAQANAVVPPTLANGESWQMRRQSRGDGYWDVLIEKSVTKPRSIDPYVAEDSHGRTVTVTQNLGQAEVPALPAKAVGKIIRRDVNVRPDCSKDVVDQAIESIEQTGEDRRATVKYSSEGTLLENVKTPAAFSAPTTPGITRTYQKRPNPDGTYQIVQRDDQAPTLAGSNSRATATLGATAGTVVLNSTSPVTPPAPAVGTTVVFDQREKDDGTYDASIRQDTSPVLSNAEAIVTKKRTSTGTGVENDRTQPAIPTVADVAEGQRLVFRRRQNEDGTWSWTRLIESIDNSGFASTGFARSYCFSLGQDVSVRSASTTNKDAEKASIISELTYGERLTWQDRENEDGTWDYTYRIEQAPALTSTAVIIREKGGVTENIRRNIDPDSKINTGSVSPVQGQTRTIRHDQNPDCSWDETDRVEIAPPLEAREYLWRKDVQAITIRKQNQNVAEDETTPTGNIIKRVVNDENPDGTWNTSEETQTPLPQEVEQLYTSAGRDARVVVFRNWTKAQVDAKFQQYKDLSGGLKTFTPAITPNEFGLYDGSLSVVDDASSASGGTAESETPREYFYSFGGVTVRSKITRFETTAATWAGQSTPGVVIPDGISDKIGVTYIGKGFYKAVKITSP